MVHGNPFAYVYEKKEIESKRRNRRTILICWFYWFVVKILWHILVDSTLDTLFEFASDIENMEKGKQKRKTKKKWSDRKSVNSWKMCLLFYLKWCWISENIEMNNKWEWNWRILTIFYLCTATGFSIKCTITVLFFFVFWFLYETNKSFDQILRTEHKVTNFHWKQTISSVFELKAMKIDWQNIFFPNFCMIKNENIKIYCHRCE